MRVDGENLGSAPIERVLLRHPDVVEVAVYGIPAPDVGDQIMAALLLADGAKFDVDEFRAFLAEQPISVPSNGPRLCGSPPSCRVPSHLGPPRQLAAGDQRQRHGGSTGGNSTG